MSPLILITICFISLTALVACILFNALINRHLLRVLRNLIRGDILKKQMELAYKIVNNARQVHYRKYAELLATIIFNKDKSICAADEGRFCPLSSNTVSLNLQLNNFTFQETFDKVHSTIIFDELFEGKYLTMGTEDYKTYIKDIVRLVNDFIWEEYGKTWLKGNGVNNSLSERADQLKSLYIDNVIIEVAVLQIFSQSKIIHEEYMLYLSRLEKEHSNNTIRIIEEIEKGAEGRWKV